MKVEIDCTKDRMKLLDYRLTHEHRVAQLMRGHMIKKEKKNKNNGGKEDE